MYFLLIFITMSFFLLFFQIVLPCHLFLLCEDKTISVFEGKIWLTCGLVWDYQLCVLWHKVRSVAASSCLSHPKLNRVLTRTGMNSVLCQSLFLFLFSFLFSFFVLLVCFCILFPCSMSIFVLFFSFLFSFFVLLVVLFSVNLCIYLFFEIRVYEIWELHNIFLFVAVSWLCVDLSSYASSQHWNNETAIRFFWLPSLLFFKVDVIFFMLLFIVQVMKKHCVISSFFFMLVWRKRYRS